MQKKKNKKEKKKSVCVLEEPQWIKTCSHDNPVETATVTAVSLQMTHLLHAHKVKEAFLCAVYCVVESNCASWT